MNTDKLLSLISKIELPERVLLGLRGLEFIGGLTGKKAIVLSDHFSKMNPSFSKKFPEDHNTKYFLHSGEPTGISREKTEKEVADFGAQYLIAVGGGSVLDISKIVKANLNIPLVAIPTTIGSGAEISKHALINNDGSKQYYSSASLIPESIILVPEFLASLSDEIIRWQILDVLAHAVEGLVSKLAHPLSDTLAIAVINELLEDRDTLIKGSFDIATKTKWQILGLISGVVQSSVGVGLTHALAHYFGPKNNLSHAQAVSMFLKDVILLNGVHTDKYRRINMDLLIEFIDDVVGTTTQPKITCDNISLATESIRRDVNSLTNPYAATQGDVQAIINRHLT